MMIVWYPKILFETTIYMKPQNHHVNHPHLQILLSWVRSVVRLRFDKFSKLVKSFHQRPFVWDSSKVLDGMASLY